MPIITLWWSPNAVSSCLTFWIGAYSTVCVFSAAPLGHWEGGGLGLKAEPAKGISEDESSRRNSPSPYGEGTTLGKQNTVSTSQVLAPKPRTRINEATPVPKCIDACGDLVDYLSAPALFWHSFSGRQQCLMGVVVSSETCTAKSQGGDWDCEHVQKRPDYSLVYVEELAHSHPTA